MLHFRLVGSKRFMGLDMWFKDDLRNILLSINASSAATARWSSDPQMVAYRQGYQAALAAVAIACGIASDLINVGSGHAPMTVPTLLIATDNPP
jgi:hypothetical protein